MPSVLDENCLGILIFCPFVHLRRSKWISVSASTRPALTKSAAIQMAEKPPSTANSTPFT